MSNESSVDMRKLQALLPSYVNNTAQAAERLFVKEALAQSAQARAALAWHESLAEKVINDVNALPSNLGWAQLQAKVRAASQLKKHSANTVWYQNLWSAVEPYMPHRWLPAPVMGGVCAGLFALVIGQGVLLSDKNAVEDFSQVRGSQPLDGPSMTGTDFVTGANSKFVKLNFKDRVSERDMRLLLVRTGAVIVSGPGQLGDYTVAIPAGELNQALQQFKDSLLTESAMAVPSPSARPTDRSGSTGSAPGQAASAAP
jgi:hypothetical protein